MRQKTLAWLILVILAIVWGSSFILMKRGLEAFSSSEVAALRISMAFLFLLPLMLKFYRINYRKYLPGLLIMGLFGNFIPAFLFTEAETQISSSLAGILNATTPIFTVLISLIWLREKPTATQNIGVLLGFVASVCLLLFAAGGDPFRNFAYGGMVMLAALSYAVSIHAIKHYLSDLSSTAATVWAFSITGPVALTYLFGFSDFVSHMQSSPYAMSSFGYVAILAIAGSAISVILYNVLIKKGGVILASSCTYLIPVVAIFWGLSDGESLNTFQYFSIVVIIVSVYLINRD